jgi:general secretion pathway protein I
MSSLRKKPFAFTLLETIIAMSILGVTLLGIFRISSMAVVSHVYAKKLTIATLLARSKMVDIEQELYDKGFNADDDELSGDFSEEGWSGFKWRAKIIAPKTQGMSPEQLIGAIFNLPMGAGAGGGKDGKSGSADPFSALGSLFGGGGAGGLGALAGLGGAGGMPDLNKLTGSLGGAGSGLGNLAGAAGGGLGQGMMQQQFQMMVDQLTKAVREVHLTVTWKEGKQTEYIDLVTHVVSMGPGSDRNGGLPGQTGQQAAANGQAQWVRADNGRPVANPVPGPNGQMVDPSDNSPVVPAGGAGVPGAAGLPGGLPGLPGGAGAIPGANRGFIPAGIGNIPGVPPIPQLPGRPGGF